MSEANPGVEYHNIRFPKEQKPKLENVQLLEINPKNIQKNIDLNDLAKLLQEDPKLVDILDLNKKLNNVKELFQNEFGANEPTEIKIEAFQESAQQTIEWAISIYKRAKKLQTTETEKKIKKLAKNENLNKLFNLTKQDTLLEKDNLEIMLTKAKEDIIHSTGITNLDSLSNNFDIPEIVKVELEFALAAYKRGKKILAETETTTNTNTQKALAEDEIEKEFFKNDLNKVNIIIETIKKGNGTDYIDELKNSQIREAINQERLRLSEEVENMSGWAKLKAKINGGTEYTKFENQLKRLGFDSIKTSPEVLSRAVNNANTRRERIATKEDTKKPGLPSIENK